MLYLVRHVHQASRDSFAMTNLGYVHFLYCAPIYCIFYIRRNFTITCFRSLYAMSHQFPAEIWERVFQHIEGSAIVQPVDIYGDPRETAWNDAQRRCQVFGFLALSSTCKLFNQIVPKFLVSWLRVREVSQLVRIRAVVSQPIRSRNGSEHNADRRLGWWTRRLDLALKARSDARVFTDIWTAYGDLVAQFLSLLPNLIVVVTSVDVESHDCYLLPREVLHALCSLKAIQRLEFVGNEGPCLGDLLDISKELSNLETLCVGRVPGPPLELPEPEEEHEDAPSVVIPKLTFLHIPRQPIYSSLRLFVMASLPSLTHLSHFHLDFDSAITVLFFRTNGHLLRSISTNGIRTSESPYASARVFTFCPNLLTFIFSPRMRDRRQAAAWSHPKLKSLGLRSILPKTMPIDTQLTMNIADSVTSLLGSILDGDLPELRSIRICDIGVVADRLFASHGSLWARRCAEKKVRLEDRQGKQLL